ncbi:MAG: glycosyltransferase family 2 protein [Candidatus Nanoarchaeia archaeon]|nr:glycosyltransferase family 2 protein [Candidatus Nanoarchaeia archaeon]
MKVIITIPAYNEEHTLGNILTEIKEVMSKTKYNYQILVLNDGSSDKTIDIAKKHNVILISNPRNLGLAETFKSEMKACLNLKADIIIHTDADGQYPSEYIPLMIKKIEEGYDLVLGSRFGKGKYSESFTKKLGNLAFARVFSGLLKTKITDTTTGFRAFTKEVAGLPLINTFTYTQEQLIRAGKKRMKITEISIQTRKTRKSRLFKNPLDYAVKAWINIFRIYRDFEPLKFFGVLGLMFFLVGFLIGLYFIYMHFTIGIQGHLGLLFLMLLLVFTGIQIVLFGFLADMTKR